MENEWAACILIYLSGGRETGNLFGVAILETILNLIQLTVLILEPLSVFSLA